MSKRRPFPLYHWSPVDRRASILRYGLRPRSLSFDRTWRPSYLCFSNSPWINWKLSGGFQDQPGQWDLWMTWSNVVTDLWKRDDGYDEWRTRQRVYKRDLWHVGVRDHQP